MLKDLFVRHIHPSRKKEYHKQEKYSTIILTEYSV